MDFDWTDYLVLAEDQLANLAPRPNGLSAADHAVLRCAISRSYYAAFHQCIAYIKSQESRYSAPTDESHNAVINDMKRLQNTIASQLANLKRNRRLADYKIPHTFTKEQCKVHIATARNVVERIDKLQGSQKNAK